MQHFIEVVKTGGADDYEAKKEKQADESEYEASEQISHDKDEAYKSSHRNRAETHNEPELHHTALFHPALMPCDLPAHFRKQRLKIELLVDAQKQHEEAHHAPEEKRPAIHILLDPG